MQSAMVAPPMTRELWTPTETVNETLIYLLWYIAVSQIGMLTNQQAMPILSLSIRKYQKPQVEIQNVMAATDLDLKIQQAMLAH